MEVLHSTLLVALLLCGAFSKLPKLIPLLRPYFHRNEVKHPEAQFMARSAPEELDVPESELVDARQDDRPIGDTISHDPATPTSTSSFYALVVGINDYPNLGPLRGATLDADRVSSFLTTDLLVPSDQIINLRNQHATREAIVQGLLSLRDDPRIGRGDPILIYYAGHGGSRRISRRRPAGSGTAAREVQVIFPYDYGMHSSNPNEPVNCIPDYTIAELLNQLAAAKGDNITVIFDSCHSASGSRDGYGGTSTLQSRSAQVRFDIPDNIDADILKTAPSRPQLSRGVDPVFCTDQASHVLLAACGSREKAWEQDQHGQFTSALLTTLKKCGVQNLTYHNLVISLPKLTYQSPHCYGANKSRVLFNSRVASHKTAYIPVTPEKGMLVLAAGAASGITFRSVWELHDSAADDSEPLGRVVAQMPRVSTTVLTPETEDDKQSIELALDPDFIAQSRLYALQVEAGVGNELKVWFSPQASELLSHESSRETNRHSNEPPRNEVGYLRHPREGAEVGVEIYESDSVPEENEVAFALFDPLAEKYGVSRLEERMPVHWGNVEAVLFAAAKWNWHLRRTNPQHAGAGNPPVQMEMYKIGESVRGGRWDFYPTSEQVPIKYGDGIPTGVVELVARDRYLYGVKLFNNRSVPLHVKMFFFDATDFSIVHLFGYSSSTDAGDAELPASGELIIGDGNDGGSPLQFTISSEKKVELGYLKVFWSTDPLELDDIVQMSAFNLRSSRGIKPVDRSRTMKDWGSACLALVQSSSSEE